MLVVIHLSSTKEKGVLFFQAFHLVPLVRVTSVQGLVRILPPLFLPGLLWKCPSSPWLLRAGLLSHSLPSHYFFIFFLKVTFPCVPCEKQSYIVKGHAGELGCGVDASIADARFLSSTVALAPRPVPGPSLLFLPYVPSSFAVLVPSAPTFRCFLVHVPCSHYCLSEKSPPLSTEKFILPDALQMLLCP